MMVRGSKTFLQYYQGDVGTGLGICEGVVVSAQVIAAGFCYCL